MLFRSSIGVDKFSDSFICVFFKEHFCGFCMKNDYFSPLKQGLNRMQLGKDAEIQATRWTRKWAERNGIDLSESGLHFQVRGEHSIPDVVYEPTKNIMDFKLTPKAVRKKQSDNFKSDFPGYSIEYIFGPGPWREQDEH